MSHIDDAEKFARKIRILETRNLILQSRVNYLEHQQSLIDCGRLIGCAAFVDSAPCGELVDKETTNIQLCAEHKQQVILDEIRINNTYPAPEPSEKTAAVYYFAWRDGSVKIGTTTDLKTRMKTLYVEQDDLLAVEPGGFDREAQRHRQFALSRKPHTELFERTPALDSHIAQVVEMFGDPKQFI